MSAMFHSKQIYNNGFQENYSSPMVFGILHGEKATEQAQFQFLADFRSLGDSPSLVNSSDSARSTIAEEEIVCPKYQHEHHVQQFFTEFGNSEDSYFRIASPPLQPCQEVITELLKIESEISELIEPQKESPISLPSLGVLNNSGSRSRRLKCENYNVPIYETAYTAPSNGHMSTHAVLRLAGEKFIQSSQRLDDFSFSSHPFPASLYGHPYQETRDVELVEYILASAEKVGRQQYERASKILNLCDELCSNKANPVQRLVYYFSEALREKIDRETGRITTKGLGKKQPFDVKEALMSPCPAAFAYHQKVPFHQLSQFTGIQLILESVGGARRVHIIDLEVRNGTHCTVLMQALAARGDCPLEHLKITAVGTKSKPKIEETGKRLIEFARSMNIPFSFNVVMVPSMLDLRKDLFDLHFEEAVAVYSPFLFCTMLVKPEWLDSLMRVITNINPRIMVVAEIESNHNSPVFVNRFIEALFYYSTFFDALEDCIDHRDPNRSTLESMYLAQGIRSVVATEGGERTSRHVKINVWRAFFARFGMAEMEISSSSMYQANLLLKNFACGSSCTLDRDEKCLMIGWKGAPVYSLSAWKFL
ncbi:hypothetical protein RJ639_041341 [Escallonia herrerae]|uniref:Uncharacterized protein n=1 Tax=Escallonia herrerae TaxID=1293975 RepID=A0AA89B2Q4_9ASTE|nr:hypothetical protein RJ639_041341 [Escallonia herrerae]